MNILKVIMFNVLILTSYSFNGNILKNFNRFGPPSLKRLANFSKIQSSTLNKAKHLSKIFSPSFNLTTNSNEQTIPVEKNLIIIDTIFRLLFGV